MEKMINVYSAADDYFYSRVTKAKAKKLVESGTPIYLILKGESLASPYTCPFPFKPEWLGIQNFEKFVKNFQARNNWKSVVFLVRA